MTPIDNVEIHAVMVADEQGCAILLLRFGNEIEDFVDVVAVRKQVAEKYDPIERSSACLRERGAQSARIAMYVADDSDRGHRRDRYQST
jgi:hypothetical protein